MLGRNAVLFDHPLSPNLAEISGINTLHRDAELLFPLIGDYVFQRRNSASKVFPGDAC